MTFQRVEKILRFLILFQLGSLLFGNERLYLKKANLLESSSLKGENVKFISGDVVFTKGNLNLYCQEGRQYEIDGLAILYNEVSAIQEDMSLTCDTIKFYSKDDQLLSIGNSHVWDNDYDLIADTITVFTNIDSGIASGNVTLVQKGQIINANRIEYKKDKSQDGLSYRAIGNVIIKDSSRVATCGLARYDRENERTILELEPEIKENNRLLAGTKITLGYEQERLKNLHIPKNASVSYTHLTLPTKA